VSEETILQEAQRIVHGDRGEAYGHPYDDYLATVTMWRAMILHRYGVDVPLTPEFGCLMMVALKVSRECNKHKRDNLVDGCGYFECADMVLERMDQLAQPSP
jgi:hypothetical protein